MNRGPYYNGCLVRRELGVGFGYLDELVKGGAILDGEVGQHFAVNGDARCDQAVDEVPVGETSRSGSGVDAGNPQFSHITFALPAVGISIAQRLEHGLMGAAVKGVPGSSMALGVGEYFSMATVSSDSSL